MAKEYVPIYFDWLEVTQDLTAEEKGNLIDAVVAYASGADYEHLLSGGCRIAFRFLKGQVDRNNAISDIRSNARANKRDQEITNQNKPEQKETNQNKTEETESNLPKEEDKEKEKEEEKDKKKDNRRFTPPSVDEVRNYCQSRNEGRGNGIDPEHFVDYYQARGWVLSNGKKVQDWKACVRTWEERRKNGPVAASVGGKGVIAQQYEQRAYTGPQRSADDILDFAEMAMSGAR